MRAWETGCRGTERTRAWETGDRKDSRLGRPEGLAPASNATRLAPRQTHMLGSTG